MQVSGLEIVKSANMNLKGKISFMKKRTIKPDKNLIYLIPTLVWIAALTLLNYFCASHILNSDISAELVLGKQLADTNRIFTTDWFYSTEIRVLYTQIVSMVLFRFIDSWNLVRTLMNFIFYAALLWSYLFAVKPLHLKKRSVYLSSLFLFIPYSIQYLYIVHIGNSYIPHFIVTFVCVGLLVRLMERKNKWLLLLFCVCSFYAGLCGIRFAMVYAIPVLLAGIMKIVIDNGCGKGSLFRKETWKSRKVGLTVLSFVTFAAGLLTNVFVLARFAVVGETNDLLMAILNDGGVITRLDNTITGILNLFGYYDFEELTSLNGAASLAAVVMFAALVFICIALAKRYTKLSDMGKYFLLLFLTAYFTNTFLFVFVAGTYVPRYYIPMMILVVPCIALYLDSEEIMGYDFHKLAAIFLAVAMNISGIAACSWCAQTDLNGPFKEVVNFLEENQLYFGLTTFWNTGVPNELSDGRVETVSIREDDITRMYTWLTSKNYLHSETWRNCRGSEIFLLLDDDIYEAFRELPMVTDGEVIYEENGYKILIYDKNYFIDTYGSQYFID